MRNRTRYSEFTRAEIAALGDLELFRLLVRHAYYREDLFSTFLEVCQRTGTPFNTAKVNKICMRNPLSDRARGLDAYISFHGSERLRELARAFEAQQLLARAQPTRLVTGIGGVRVQINGQPILTGVDYAALELRTHAAMYPK